ncbi:MAG: DEAD/DEAH box helicase [Pirellulaceae bacterium]
MSGSEQVDRDQLAADFFEQLPFAPYSVQEDALFAWFSSEQGVLVSAPTGTGKTLIAEAAVYESLRTGRRCYYTTPLIALTDQKLIELQQAAVRWGFSPDQIGLVTGNRRVNPEAPVLVVVAEILLNRLLHPEAFTWNDVHAVVMDEFHSFNDPERGIVWELSLALLPSHVRTLLLSATVGNSEPFRQWLARAHGRRLELVQGTERKVPLQFWWVDDAMLDEQMERMAEGDEPTRRTPALLFCFNRDQCWQVAEWLKGKKMIDKERQAILSKRLEAFDFTQGAGPRIRQLLQRGVGIHHAGILPQYRRICETLFQEKLLSVTVCTETLSAGINLPARSVVLPTLLKGPRRKRVLIEPSSAHQIFGRAGRPQYDREGFVFALAHEDDVKYLKWKAKYDQIPEDTKDPNLIRAKKQLKKKMPKRREGETYWNQQQFEKLQHAPSAQLASRGAIPWRMLAYSLDRNPQVQPLRDLVGKRLMTPKEIEAAQKYLNQQLITLWTAGYLALAPKPQPLDSPPTKPQAGPASSLRETLVAPPSPPGLLDGFGISAATIPSARKDPGPLTAAGPERSGRSDRVGQSDFEGADANDPESEEGFSLLDSEEDDESSQEAGGAVIPPIVLESRGYDLEGYRPIEAAPSEKLQRLLRIRSMHPLYAEFLVAHAAVADPQERIQLFESVLELPGSVARLVPVPSLDEMPLGSLATERLHPRLLELGLALPSELVGNQAEEESPEELLAQDRRSGRPMRSWEAPPPRILTLGEKLLRLFHYDFPGVHDVHVSPVWVVGELLDFEADFHRYIRAKGLQKQEGVVFRHVLRFLLLLDELASIPPFESTVETWEDPLDQWIDQLTACCRAVDPQSTDEVLDSSRIDELLLGQPSLRRDQLPPVR